MIGFKLAIFTSRLVFEYFWWISCGNCRGFYRVAEGYISWSTSRRGREKVLDILFMRVRLFASVWVYPRLIIARQVRTLSAHGTVYPFAPRYDALGGFESCVRDFLNCSWKFSCNGRHDWFNPGSIFSELMGWAFGPDEGLIGRSVGEGGTREIKKIADRGFVNVR